MKLITTENKGFYASVCDTLRHIRICEETGESFHVQWGPESLYYDVTAGLNAWEYFFKQPDAIVPSGALTEVHGYAEIPEKGDDFRKTMHRLIEQYLKYSNNACDYISAFHENFPIHEPILGVHVRFTDKNRWQQFGEPPSAKPIDIHTYLEYADHALENRHLNYIFLASDNIEAVNAFSKRFGKRLIHTNCDRSTGSASIHSDMKNISGKRKGLAVMVDVEGLACCDFLIRSTSNVGSFAQFMNTDLEHINLNEVLQGDTREQEYGLKSVTL